MLPLSMRDDLVAELDDYLDGLPDSADAETLTAYAIQVIEQLADDLAIDDVVGWLEDEGALDGALQESLESEILSSEEIETGEDLIVLLEGLCNIEWSEDDELDDDDDDDDD